MLLLPENAKLLGQGITGSEGARALPRMLSYGTQIVAGVTPGKGGQEVEGEVVAINDKEITLDLGTKSEGIIPTRDIPADQKASLKIGNKLKAFVHIVENDSGQVLLSSYPYSGKTTSFKGSLLSVFFTPK